MDVGRRSGARNSIVAGSVWESRMKSDEVKGGIKVFINGEEDSEEAAGGGGGDDGGGGGGGGGDGNRKMKTTQTGGVSGRRKTWKSESFEGIKKSPVQKSKGKSELQKNCDEQCKELSVSVDSGVKRSPPIQARKTRSDASKELSLSSDGIERSPIQLRKTRSESNRGPKVGDNADGIERNSPQLRKAKSVIDKSGEGVVEGNEKNPIDQMGKVKLNNKVIDESSGFEEIEKSPIDQMGKEKLSNKVIDESSGFEAIEKNPVELEKAKAEKIDESGKSSVDIGCDDGIEENPIEVKTTRSDEVCKDLDVCQEKVITSNFTNVGDQVKSAPKVLPDEDDDHDDENDHDEEDEEDEEIEVEIEKKSIEIKEINVSEQKQPNNVVIEDKKKLHQFHQKSEPSSPIVNKQPPPVVKRSAVYQNLNKPSSNFAKPSSNLAKPSSNFAKPTSNLAKPTSNFTKSTRNPPISNPIRNSYESQKTRPRTHGRLQNLVDLILWRDVSRSAFIFGVGTFITISSSYTKDLNISFISVISYLGLVYLGLIFLYRSIIFRGSVDEEESRQEYVVGEEEAIWILKMVLPYINEFLLNLRALFSGDPATTMKLAVVMFVLARCGSSITIWKLAKLGFFGVFTVPKFFSSYSTQLTNYGKFWVQRFRDAWESCTHKKAVAVAIFTLVWNLSSITARIWALFMLFVAFRYYQHSLVRDDWVEDDACCDDTDQVSKDRQRQDRSPTMVESIKERKSS